MLRVTTGFYQGYLIKDGLMSAFLVTLMEVDANYDATTTERSQRTLWRLPSIRALSRYHNIIDPVSTIMNTALKHMHYFYFTFSLNVNN